MATEDASEGIVPSRETEEDGYDPLRSARFCLERAATVPGGATKSELAQASQAHAAIAQAEELRKLRELLSAKEPPWAFIYTAPDPS
jgi:hypothetical protein